MKSNVFKKLIDIEMVLLLFIFESITGTKRICKCGLNFIKLPIYNLKKYTQILHNKFINEFKYKLNCKINILALKKGTQAI